MMNKRISLLNLNTIRLLVMVVVVGIGNSANADDEATLESTPESTIKLIRSMVDHGALSREKAQAMIKDAEWQAALAKAATATAAATASEEVRAQIKREVLAELKGQMAEDIKHQVLAELTGAGSSPTMIGSPSADAVSQATDAPGAKAKPHLVRVPYVPESMRREIRDQVKQEVLAQAKEERWGNPGALPEWLDRFNFEGDVRLRYDSFRLGKDNTEPTYNNYVVGDALTRAPDFAGPGGNSKGGNTQQDFSRERLRLRFGATAKVSDTVAAGFRIATGNITGPTSTNQTLGQGQNKYSLVLDRGFVTVKPSIDWSLTGGRIANPFMSTDLVWADDLNFEGAAVNYTPRIASDATAFLTAGWFPLRTDNPSQTTSRDLKGFQGGVKWKLAPTTDFNFAAALYKYSGIEGQQETIDRFNNGATDYGIRYEYPSTMRQRGNTLLVVNAPNPAPLSPIFWGLASGFKELNLTGTLDVARFDPFHIVLTGDYVKNLAFDRNKMSARADPTGAIKITDGKDYGYLGKIMVGNPAMTRWGDWNMSLTYRWLGSDAVLDAFTNSDFGMGGTNNKGYIMGANWGIDKNAWLSAKWMASELIDSAAPKVAGSSTAPTQLKVDLFQLDLNAKF